VNIALRISKLTATLIRGQNDNTTAELMPAINVRVDQDLWSDLKAQKPHFLSDTAYLNLVISQAIASTDRLDGATEPASGQHSLGRSPSKAVNKRNKEKEISEDLLQHSELIRQFWKHKGGKKSDLAWTGLMRELGKIQTHMEGGSQAVAEQLQKGAENGWQSITLANYLKIAVGRSNAPAQSGSVDWAEVDRLTFGGAA
jgi:hypothetical protein